MNTINDLATDFMVDYMKVDASMCDKCAHIEYYDEGCEIIFSNKAHQCPAFTEYVGSLIRNA